MKPFWIAFVLLLTPTLPTFAQKPDLYTQHFSRAERDLFKVHQQRRFTTIRGEIPALSRFLHPDLVYVHSNGKTDTKASFLESIKSGALRYEAIEDQGNGIFSGPTISVLSGTVQMRVKTPERVLSFQAHYTAVYCRDKKNGWQLLRWQTTRFPEPEKSK